MLLQIATGVVDSTPTLAPSCSKNYSFKIILMDEDVPDPYLV
jgi:hypothetical protein